MSDALQRSSLSSNRKGGRAVSTPTVPPTGENPASHPRDTGPPPALSSLWDGVCSGPESPLHSQPRRSAVWLSEAQKRGASRSTAVTSLTPTHPTPEINNPSALTSDLFKEIGARTTDTRCVPAVCLPAPPSFPFAGDTFQESASRPPTALPPQRPQSCLAGSRVRPLNGQVVEPEQG